MSVHLPRVQAREVDDLIEREVIPHASRDEFVRDAVARYLREIKNEPRNAAASSGTAGMSSFAADPTNASAQPAFGPVRSDRRSVPGIDPASERAVGVGGI